MTPGFEEMDFVRFDGETTDPQLILEVAQTSPFGSPYRLVVVEGIDEADADSAPWLAQVLQQPHPKVRIVLCAEKLDDKTQTLLRAKPETVQVLWCRPLKGREIGRAHV